ncbi:putative RNA methyltransferase [Marinobacter sp. X15-166B]|uniref:putative RNA methyltransferase n=1 Tax=Marinobacter sp. X15-166B TaxID=1897620 RepID=UPI00085C7A57|nr:methyltransferase domain-containing protein [Marinobacter sp. X15-166B]OEY67159.1 rRNA (guanine-N1)-methyltransferase [Marinobacter sp. X15-166B]
MTVTPFQALVCPLDGHPLEPVGASWRCTGGHNFDVARQGYLHLLPVQNKRTRDPGDSKEMVAARQRFLNAGWYQPIARAVTRLATLGLPPAETVSCLDAGCGEGYYLRELMGATDAQPVWQMLGLDISKWAIVAAAKQSRQARWVVGSNANLPVQPASVDRILCVFGFPVYAEFARVLRAGGVLIQVDAGPDHLRELREIIYPSIKAARTGEAAVPAGFSPEGVERVCYSLALDDAQSIADLLAMTPHLYRASAEGRAKAAALQSLQVTVDVRLSWFTRTPEVAGQSAPPL